MERGSTELLWRVSLIGLVFGTLVVGRGRDWMSVVVGRRGSDQMESSSDGIICRDWRF